MGICLNCNAEVTGKYCSNCGQKRTEPQERSLWKFIVHFFNEFLNWDSKFWHSFIPVLIKPGYLTDEYNKGRVQGYISPLKIYLCISLVVFFFSSKFDSDVISPLVEDEDSMYKGYIEKVISDKGITFVRFAEKFNSEANDKLPIYTLLMVFAFSLPVWLLYGMKRKYYVEHLVFSLHFYCFVLIAIVIGDLFEKINENLMLPFLFVIPPIFMFFALRRVYKERMFVTLIKWSFLSTIFCLLWFVWFIAVFFITTWTV